MIEISFAAIVFVLWTFFAVLYYNRYKKYCVSNGDKKQKKWTNEYIFETIPSVFPTLGIFCTALGITIGIWDFNTNDIQGSIPQLLGGLKLAFLATMAGIVGLIVFQKWGAIIQKEIEDNPNKQKKYTDELNAISELNLSIHKLHEDNNKHFEKLSDSFEKVLNEKIEALEGELKAVVKTLNTNHKSLLNSSENINNGIVKLSDEFVEGSVTANNNTAQIITAMTQNNTLIAKKFDEFSELLAQNNTEALVEVMKSVTEQFNAQMNELINKLVQENFSELNASVQNLNDWQKENKEQIAKLTEKFQETTEMFDTSSKTLSEVADNAKSLVADNSKLVQLIDTLDKVMISDNKFSAITSNLVATIDTLKETTESFDETTNKLNEWVRTERNFKDSADILIVKLEEFRDMNSDVWKKYREEMANAVGIIKTTSTSLGEDLTNINNEFYDRLSETLTNLDLCIQRFIPANN